MRPGPPAEQIPNPEPRYCEDPCPQSCAPACYDWCCYPAILPPTQPVKIVMVKKPANAGSPNPPMPNAQPPPPPQVNMQTDPCMFSSCFSKKDIVANASNYDVKSNLNSNQSSSLSPSNATDLTSSRSNATSLNGAAMIDGKTEAPLNSSIEKPENLTSNAIAENNQPITLRTVNSANETNSNSTTPLSNSETSNVANTTSNDGKLEPSSKQTSLNSQPANPIAASSPLVTKDTYKKTTTEASPKKSHKRSHLKHKNHKGYIRTEM